MHTPPPEHLVDKAVVPGFVGIRSWADKLSDDYQQDFRARRNQLKRTGLHNKPLNVLALSGGGANGAFGAGVLNGWSAKGTRPKFEIVTGVSTGALIAPLAFLGQNYDAELKHFYTSISSKDVYVSNLLGGLVGGSALASTSPLEKLIADVVDYDLLKKIAAQHARGRRLYVVTTNLEAERPVIWNMGLIASHKNTEALELFRSVLLASSAIPGAFPPVVLKVEAEGKAYTELQVDGGTTANSYVAPLNTSVPKEIFDRNKTIFVIQDGKLSPGYKSLTPRTLAMAGRGINTLLKYKNYADIRRLYLLAEHHGADFRIISIPNSFDRLSRETFDKEYMNALYDLGYSMGRSGTEWVSKPDVF